MQLTQHQSTRKVAQTAQEVCTLVHLHTCLMERWETRKIDPVDLELKDRNENPYHSKT
jgi:hypothetical protein